MAGGVFRRAEIIGIRLTATSHEASNAIVMVIATSPRKIVIWLRAPSRFGRNTMMLAVVPAVIAICTDFVPSIAQRIGSLGHFSRYW